MTSSRTTATGRNFHFGIREHASAAIANGMAVSKLRPFWSGFLIFSDYARGAIRLSALMEIPVVHIFTHDSIGVGEDGPTHQPVEHLISLRAIPGLLVFRPADANEVAETWRYVAQLKREPAVLILSRQALPTVDRSVMAPASEVTKGAYVLVDAEDGEPDVILIGTGSEVGWRSRRARSSRAREFEARVVSMPCSELFDRQPQAYRDKVLPPCDQGPRRDRAGVDARLASVRRRRRRDRGHAHVRRLGAAQAARREVRVHPRRGRPRSRASAWPRPEATRRGERT